MSCKISFMHTPATDPVAPQADAIVAALARLRGRRGPHPGGGRGHSGGGLGGPGPWGRGHFGEHGDAERHDTPGAWPGPPGPGFRERFGGPAQFRLLGTLAHASTPLTVSALAEQIGVDQPRASRLVQQSIERGFAVREADPDDARRTLVRITDAGLRAVHGFRGRQREDVSVALSALTEAERDELVRLMTKLADAWPGA